VRSSASIFGLARSKKEISRPNFEFIEFFPFQKKFHCVKIRKHNYNNDCKKELEVSYCSSFKMMFIPGMQQPGEDYFPIKAGSIDGTDTNPHDRGIKRADLCADLGLCMYNCLLYYIIHLFNIKHNIFNI
jgi:hypothetical protein